jgi:hypothetical protein
MRAAVASAAAGVVLISLVTSMQTHAQPSPPEKSISICKIAKNVGRYYGEEIRTSAVFLSGFDIITLRDKRCDKVSFGMIMDDWKKNESFFDEIAKYGDPASTMPKPAFLIDATLEITRETSLGGWSGGFKIKKVWSYKVLPDRRPPSP